jgi:SLT domain-containing protein
MNPGFPFRRFAVTTILAAVAFQAPAGAAIHQQYSDNGVVFISRPHQKPSEDSSGPINAPRLRPVSSHEIDGLVQDVSRRYDMDPSLIATVVGVESGFNKMAVSPKGARGLMQLMPDTARQYGVRDVHDARENLEGGVAYLSDLARRYNGDMRLALAAYNAGPEAVERASGVPNYRETRDYLQRIESRYGQTLSVKAMRSGRAARPGGGSIVATRGQDGTLVATNLHSNGVTLIQKQRRIRKRP